MTNLHIAANEIPLSLVALAGGVLDRRMAPPRAASKSVEQIDLADLMELVARDGDRLAFGRLFTHFAPRLKAYLRKQGSSDSVAEDLVQEVMLTVWRRAHLFDRRQAGVSTWLFTIARNKRIDALRRERRPEIDPEDPLLVGSPDPHPDEAMEAAQKGERIRGAMVELPAAQAHLLRMSYFEDKSHTEIAAELDLPLGTVKSRIRLAMQRLRTMIEDDT